MKRIFCAVLCFCLIINSAYAVPQRLRLATSKANEQASNAISSIASLPNLYAHWRADTDVYQDLAGTTPATTTGQRVNLWNDQSSNGNDLSAAGLSGPEYSLSTSNQYPSLKFGAFDGANYLSTVSKSTEFCIVILGYGNSLVNYARPGGGRRNGTTKGFSVISYNSKWALNLFSPRNSVEIIVTGSTNISTNADVPQHVVISYNGSGNASGVVGIYVNGAAETLTTVSDNLAGNDIVDAAGLFEPASHPWGRIMEWAMANYVCTAEDAAALYATAQSDWGL